MVWEVEVRKVSCQATQAMCGGPPPSRLTLTSKSTRRLLLPSMLCSKAKLPIHGEACLPMCPSHPGQTRPSQRAEVSVGQSPEKTELMPEDHRILQEAVIHSESCYMPDGSFPTARLKSDPWKFLSKGRRRSAHVPCGQSICWVFPG